MHIKIYYIFPLNIVFRYAKKVSIGDELLIQKENRLTPTKVIRLSNMTMQGNLYSSCNCQTKSP